MKYSQHYILATKREDGFINTKFVKWVDTIESIVVEQLGMGLLDIPDELYMISFEDGVLPDKMASSIVKEYQEGVFGLVN